MLIYFHITHEDFGDDFMFEVSLPKTALNSESKITNRICVSTSIDGCMMGIFGLRSMSNYKNKHPWYSQFYIYQFDGDFYKPTKMECSDVNVTDEHWILVDTIGFKVGTINMEILFKDGKATFNK